MALSFKDNANPTPENGANSTPQRGRRAAFGQSLPRTAPIPSDAKEYRKRREKALFNVPDWRPEEEIILEAASRDPKIKLPERLRPKDPKVIEGRVRKHEPPRSKAKPLPESSDKAAIEPAEEGTHYAPPPVKPPMREESPAESGSPLLNPPETHSSERPTPAAPRLTTPTPPTPAASPAQLNQVETAARIIGNLAALIVPTLCVLLLSGWGPTEIAVVFEDFWPYLGLASLITIVLVVLDQVAQALAGMMHLAKPAAWIMEFVFSALGAGLCLHFFTHSVLGAFFLALVMSVLTSLFSMIVAKLF